MSRNNIIDIGHFSVLNTFLAVLYSALSSTVLRHMMFFSVDVYISLHNHYLDERCVFLCYFLIIMISVNGGLSRLHSADEGAVSWLTSYGL